MNFSILSTNIGWRHQCWNGKIFGSNFLWCNFGCPFQLSVIPCDTSPIFLTFLATIEREVTLAMILASNFFLLFQIRSITPRNSDVTIPIARMINAEYTSAIRALWKVVGARHLGISGSIFSLILSITPRSLILRMLEWIENFPIYIMNELIRVVGKWYIVGVWDTLY